MKGFVWLAIILASAHAIAMEFRPPTREEALKAIGTTIGLATNLRRALDPGDNFATIPVPSQGDWLAVHPEAGQTFDDFLNEGAHKPGTLRHKIYLQPLGLFQEGRSPSLQLLQDYGAAYFDMIVELLPALSLDSLPLTSRINPLTGTRQVLTKDILALLKERLPGDAFCLLAVTMEDLYPDPSWNFVFGQASIEKRVGVFSFARYDPAFYGEVRGKDYRRLLLRRSCKVLAHEIGHMFSLQHCVFFRCVMNGSNHLQESDARPLSLCPVCLRKLQYSIGFDVADRYRGLLDFYRELGFYGEAKWVSNRLKRIVINDDDTSSPWSR